MGSLEHRSAISKRELPAGIIAVLLLCCGAASVAGLVYRSGDIGGCSGPVQSTPTVSTLVPTFEAPANATPIPIVPTSTPAVPPTADATSTPIPPVLTSTPTPLPNDRCRWNRRLGGHSHGSE
jgi:hypothetical protein